MQKFLFIGAVVFAASGTQLAFAASTDPHSIQGKCAKANGGHHVPGTKHQWQTYNFDAWYRCVNAAALAEKRAMGFKD